LPASYRVIVGVAQTRNDCSATQIQDLRTRAGQSLNFVVRSNRDDSVAVDRNRLGNQIRCVHREDAAVEENPRGRIAREGGCGDKAGGESDRNDFP
jgi:hypothetical protein